MSIPFDIDEWWPTKPQKQGDPELGKSDLEELCEKVSTQTSKILKYPYNPNNWLRRAHTLSCLRYPELAVGDAYKARVLCSTHLELLTRLNYYWRGGVDGIGDGNGTEGKNEDGGCNEGRGKWQLGYEMGFWMEDPHPRGAKDDGVCARELEAVRWHAHQAENDNLHYHPGYDAGKFRRRLYPWTAHEHRNRSDELITTINREFAENAKHVLGCVTTCVVQRHAFGQAENERDSSELLGLFAARDLDNDETILIDRARTWGCIGPGKNGSKSNLNGGLGCGDPIHPNDESDETTVDLRWIRDRAGKYAASIILNCRLLLCCIQDGITHPLDHPLVARLTPTYHEYRNATFALEDDIAIPNEALQQFGIDIFANHNFDTWILFTIFARTMNNGCSNPISETLNPLFSLFNHSCEPNVEWMSADDHRTLEVRTAREIKKGEQLFVRYDGYTQDMSLSERRKTMKRWLDADCQCSRCVKEEKEQKEIGMDELAGAKEIQGWDVDVLPVFPEDQYWSGKH